MWTGPDNRCKCVYTDLNLLEKRMSSTGRWNWRGEKRVRYENLQSVSEQNIVLNVLFLVLRLSPLRCVKLRLNIIIGKLIHGVTIHRNHGATSGDSTCCYREASYCSPTLAGSLLSEHYFSLFPNLATINRFQYVSLSPRLCKKPLKFGGWGH